MPFVIHAKPFNFDSFFASLTVRQRQLAPISLLRDFERKKEMYATQ